MEKKDINCFVFCDFSKAFDKVWHRGLICIMKVYGVDGNVLNWFQDYLHDRQQIVVLNNSSYSFCNVSAGVPQGSVLRVLLFVLYINDIADKLTSLCRLFADDTSFNYSGNDGEPINLLSIATWKSWMFGLLNGLCHLTQIKLKLWFFFETPDLSFSLNGKNIPLSISHKHLVVNFSSDAKWNNHIESIIIRQCKETLKCFT